MTVTIQLPSHNLDIIVQKVTTGKFNSCHFESYHILNQIHHDKIEETSSDLKLKK